MLLKDLGWTALAIDRYEEAIDLYDQALLINPHEADCWYWRGVALERLGRGEEARLSFERVLALETGHHGVQTPRQAIRVSSR